MFQTAREPGVVRRPTWRALVRGSGTLAALAALLLLSACSSAEPGGPGGPSSSSGSVLNQRVPLSATPAYLPSAGPRCSGSTNVAVTIPSSLDHLVSACTSQSQDRLVVTNISEFVLDLSSADSTRPHMAVQPYDAFGELLAAADKLEREVQNAAVAAWQAPNGPVLLPVGAQLVATSSQPVQLTVGVAQNASASSFGAELMTAYVVDGLPEDSIPSYYDSLASCVNDAYKLWDELTQQSHPSVGSLMQRALETVASCRALQRKLAADPAAEHPASDGLQPDLSTAADHAGQDDWESNSEQVDGVEGNIR